MVETFQALLSIDIVHLTLINTYWLFVDQN